MLLRCCLWCHGPNQAITSGGREGGGRRGNNRVGGKAIPPTEKSRHHHDGSGRDVVGGRLARPSCCCEMGTCSTYILPAAAAYFNVPPRAGPLANLAAGGRPQALLQCPYDMPTSTTYYIPARTFKRAHSTFTQGRRGDKKRREGGEGNCLHLLVLTTGRGIRCVCCSKPSQGKANRALLPVLCGGGRTRNSSSSETHYAPRALRGSYLRPWAVGKARITRDDDNENCRLLLQGRTTIVSWGQLKPRLPQPLIVNYLPTSPLHNCGRRRS